MQMGYNTDIDHHGITVHTQTEDHGMGDKKITTQVFFSGRILDSRTISYAEAISKIEEDDKQCNEITRRMRAIHKHFINRIRAGEYDVKLPIEGAAAPPAVAKKVAVAAATVPSLTTEITALAAEELITDEALEARLENPGLDDDDIDFEMLLNQKERTWRGHDNDFNTDLGESLRAALGV